MSKTVDTLSSLSLPESLGVQRDHIVPEASRPPSFGEQYDFYTLFYDAFFVPGDLSIRLVCPRLLNFEKVIEEATFTANGEQLEPRFFRQNWRNDGVALDCSAAASTLHMRFRSMDVEIPLGSQDLESFRGLRCAILKSKDNDLAWISDWATFHVQVHGLQGLVLFDNGSDQYSLDDVSRALLQIEGLQAFRVLSADFPFGPSADGEDLHKAKFLQGALVEIARFRYLEHAAAVLLVDIDELVSPIPDSSIFVLAESSFWGYVSIPGRWQYPQCAAGAPARHVDHVYVSPKDAPCRSKYCVVPRGRLRRLYWDLHSLGCGRSPWSLLCRTLLRRALARIRITENVLFWHCRRITTNWKYVRDVPPADQLSLDCESSVALHRVFKGAGSG